MIYKLSQLSDIKLAASSAMLILIKPVSDVVLNASFTVLDKNIYLQHLNLRKLHSFLLLNAELHWNGFELGLYSEVPPKDEVIFEPPSKFASFSVKLLNTIVSPVGSVAVIVPISSPSLLFSFILPNVWSFTVGLILLTTAIWKGKYAIAEVSSPLT